MTNQELIDLDFGAAIGRVIGYVTVGDFVSATTILSKKLTVKATRRQKKASASNFELVVCAGPPNYAARQRIKGLKPDEFPFTFVKQEVKKNGKNRHK